MSLIKISPKFQITIPRRYRYLCPTDWIFIRDEGGILTLRPVQIQPAQTEQEILDELVKKYSGAGGQD